MRKIIHQQTGEVFGSIALASKALNIQESHIKKILSGKQKSYQGQSFEYY